MLLAIQFKFKFPMFSIKSNLLFLYKSCECEDQSQLCCVSKKIGIAKDTFYPPKKWQITFVGFLR
jgi:hypothetical protein